MDLSKCPYLWNGQICNGILAVLLWMLCIPRIRKCTWTGFRLLGRFWCHEAQQPSQQQPYVDAILYSKCVIYMQNRIIWNPHLSEQINGMHTHLATTNSIYNNVTLKQNIHLLWVWNEEDGRFDTPKISRMPFIFVQMEYSTHKHTHSLTHSLTLVPIFMFRVWCAHLFSWPFCNKATRVDGSEKTMASRPNA